MSFTCQSAEPLVGSWRAQAIANAKAGEAELTEEEIWTIRKAVDQTKL